MPGPSRLQLRAEAKFNVATDFPRHDLHFAAASGNLGLVEFALNQGQPINSVLNGVLPIHAACAGGSEIVVKYLLDEGADVNAPRIPRRYSNEKSSGLTLGASGSTPLHFAAANGHLGVIKLLLERGAVPDRADKHGTTPEMLARQNGWLECAELLRTWSENRQGDSASSNKDVSHDRERCDIADTATNIFHASARKLQMKRSIDNAVHILRHPHIHHCHSQQHLRLSHSPSIHSSHSVGASPSPSSPIRSQSVERTAPPGSPTHEDALAARRPSLPHIFNEPPTSFTRRTSSRLRRRPRSAGTGADQGDASSTTSQPSSINTESNAGSHRRLGGKISLLHLFKRANDNANDPEQGSPQSDSSIHLATSPLQTSPSPLRASPSHSPSPAPESEQQRNGPGVPASSMLTPKPELRHKTSRDHLREIAQSSDGSSPYIDELSTSQITRPSILRGHGRHSSSQSSSPAASSARILRFDSSSNGSSPSTSTYNVSDYGVRRQVLPHTPSNLRATRSVSSLRNGESSDSGKLQIPDSAPPDVSAFDGQSSAYQSYQPRRVNSMNTRPRGPSFASSISSMSAGISSSESTGNSPGEFTYTITKGSLSPIPSSVSVRDQAQIHLPVKALSRLEIADGRERSTSISSVETDVSNELESSASSNVSATTSATTPYLASSSVIPDSLDQNALEALPSPKIGNGSPTSSTSGLSADRNVSTTEVLRTLMKCPTLDLRSISNHSEAEELLKRTESEILASASLSDDDPESPKIPLSAQLAAYGEILALERRFARGEKQRRQWSFQEESDDEDENEDNTLTKPKVKMASKGGSMTKKTDNSAVLLPQKIVT